VSVIVMHDLGSPRKVITAHSPFATLAFISLGLCAN